MVATGLVCIGSLLTMHSLMIYGKFTLAAKSLPKAPLSEAQCAALMDKIPAYAKVQVTSTVQTFNTLMAPMQPQLAAAADRAKTTYESLSAEAQRKASRMRVEAAAEPAPLATPPSLARRRLRIEGRPCARAGRREMYLICLHIISISAMQMSVNLLVAFAALSW